MKTLTIRPYEPADLEAVRKLHVLALESAGAVFHPGPWDADLDHIDEVYANNRGIFLTGWIDGSLIVMGALRKIDETTCELKRMRVHPDYQRKGFGQQMLERLEAAAHDLGYKKIQLDTSINQTAAQKLYEKYGYKEVRRETEGWPVEAIIYEKQFN